MHIFSSLGSTCCYTFNPLQINIYIYIVHEFAMTVQTCWKYFSFSYVRECAESVKRNFVNRNAYVFTCIYLLINVSEKTELITFSV